MPFDGDYAKYLYLPINEVDEVISSLKETYFGRIVDEIFWYEFKSVLDWRAVPIFKKSHDEMMNDAVLCSGIFRLT